MVEHEPSEVNFAMPQASPSPFMTAEGADVEQIEEDVSGVMKQESRVAFNVEQAEGLEDSAHSRKKRKKKLHKEATTTIRARKDVVWQENPDRILKYRATHLHYYGWIPFIMLRNLKATVFYDIYIHLQTMILVSWVALVHLTGLSVRDDDLRMFVKLFGTPWAGSILNLGMVMVFILGLFISLVINRWSAIRQAYSQLRSTTLDLCMILANAIESQHKREAKQTMQARTELVRLLNLGHLLVVTRADKEDSMFRKSRGVKTITKHAFRSFKHAMFELGFSMNTVHSVQDKWDEVWLKKASEITFYDLNNEGLVNPDEWSLLAKSERDGLPSYQTVYYWVQVLIHKCRAAGWIISAPQMHPMILTKVNTIASSGSTLLNAISSQMPYPYVHLVSFVAHAYLIVLASWFGCFLRVGYPEDKPYHAEQSSDIVQNPSTSVGDNIWTCFWIYILLAVANILFQGLLNMHTLLDNPFGKHCAKFPLRAQVSQVINATRAMLTCGDEVPKAFADVFGLGHDLYSDPRDFSMSKVSSTGSEFADFLRPPAHRNSSQQGLQAHPSVTRGQLREGNPPRGSPKSDRPSRKIVTARSMETVHEATNDLTTDLQAERIEADEAMVRLSEPPAAPRTTKCVSQGLTIHNQIVFGNLQGRRTPYRHNISGDATLQELFLQVSVADAVQHSFSALRRSLESQDVSFNLPQQFPGPSERHRTDHYDSRSI